MPSPKRTKPKVQDLLANNLKRLREDAGLTQSEMAFAIGKFQDYVSRLEAGKLNVTVQTLQAYVDALAIEPTELLKPVQRP